MALLFMFSGAVIGMLVLIVIAELNAGRARSTMDGRKAAAKQILTDLLMLADIDTTAVLPRDYKRRIERWLDPSGYNDNTRTGSYRDVAKLLDELVHPRDLDGELPMLPSSIQVRAEKWLGQHRKALTAGK